MNTMSQHREAADLRAKASGANVLISLESELCFSPILSPGTAGYI